MSSSLIRVAVKVVLLVHGYKTTYSKKIEIICAFFNLGPNFIFYSTFLNLNLS